MKHLPNILTILRLILSLAVFFALVVIGAGQGLDPQVATWLARLTFAGFVIAAVTDFFDGWLARRWKVTSVAGAILDPIADKILVCGAILGLLAIGAPGVIIPGGVILFREFAVSALREVLAPRGLKLPVTMLAKTKTTLQLIALGAILFMMVWPVWRIDARIDHLRQALDAAVLLLNVAALVTLWTGLEYGRAAWLALKGEAGA
jgi:CDP-diacylglycerol--glycerol-3-phosphate 3-phosphatidyltransferase